MNPMARWGDQGRYEGKDDDSRQQGEPLQIVYKGKGFGTIVEVGQFDKQWQGRMLDSMTFATPLHVEADDDVEVDWVKRTARVVKRRGE